VKLGFVKAVTEQVRLGLHEGAWINGLRRKKPKRGQKVGDDYISPSTHLALKGVTQDQYEAIGMAYVHRYEEKEWRRKNQANVWGSEFSMRFEEEPECLEAGDDCPKCGGELQAARHRYDQDGGAPDCDWLACNECEFRTDPE